jgi:hypothetical protein
LPAAGPRRQLFKLTGPADISDGLKGGKIIGEKKSGDWILSDAELFAFWRAMKRLPYAWRQAYQILSLTALRLDEAADVS